MPADMPGRLARWIYGAAAAYGFLVLTPLLFAEGQIAKVDGHPLGHPEYYYGFLAAALTFQVVFVLIARHPVRLRPVMRLRPVWTTRGNSRPPRIFLNRTPKGEHTDHAILEIQR